MKKKLIVSCAMGLFFGGMISSVLATSLEIALIDGDWSNAVPTSATTDITINNSGSSGGLSTARWGVGNRQSGYNFLTSTAPLTVESDGAAFALGSLTHLNFPVSGTVLDSIDLDIHLGNIFTLDTTFHIDHNETPNNGPNPNDIVTILNPIVNQQFDYSGRSYFFNLFGFSQDGGSTLSNVFSTIEGQANTASLYGRITDAPVPSDAPVHSSVPEPTAMLLLGTSLVGLVGVRRKKR